jgi:hypothetical protein
MGASLSDLSSQIPGMKGGSSPRSGSLHRFSVHYFFSHLLLRCLSRCFRDSGLSRFFFEISLAQPGDQLDRSNVFTGSNVFIATSKIRAFTVKESKREAHSDISTFSSETIRSLDKPIHVVYDFTIYLKGDRSET